MSWISIDFSEVYQDLSPTFFRDEVFSAFSNAFAKPLQTVADKTLYEMQHDSRVINLEKVLNEYFEVGTYHADSHLATRQVYIVDAPEPPKSYIYQPLENQPMYLGSVYLDRENIVNVDFIVKIPASFTYNELRLRAVIDFYKLAGKKYIIETY